MKEKFINSSLAFINKYQDCNEVKNIRLKYGLEGIYSLITKLGVSIIISIFTKTTFEIFLFIIFYAGIRTFSFGLHAKSNLSCWIFTILIYTIIPCIIKYYPLTKNICYIFMLIGLISIILFSPADTPKRPLKRKNERISLKLKSLIVFTIYITAIYYTNSPLVYNVLSISILLESILINPISYFLTKTSYNNYKK